MCVDLYELGVVEEVEEELSWLWRGAEYATPKYASLAYGLFWADYSWETCRHRRISENSRIYPFVRDIYIYKGILLFSGSPSFYQEEKNDSKSQETFINGEGPDFILHNHFHSA